MSGMMDARCRCGRRFGWRGKVTDRPPCPACKHTVPLADLEREQAKIDKIIARCDRKLPCGHTEGDLCGGPGEPAWCGPCRAEANARKKAGREPPIDPYDFEERAAILEFEAGMSRCEAERLAGKAGREPPPEPHGARRSP